MARIHTHPGEVLGEEFLAPSGLSVRQLAHYLGVPANRISDIIRGRRAVTADTAKRLGIYFRTSPQFWTNLQTSYDLSQAEATHDYSTVRRAETV